MLLGVLVKGPAHGYDVKRVYDERFPGTRPLAFGQVYAALARLRRDGLVEEVGRGSEGGPERTVYAVTEHGEDALREWLLETEPPGPYRADALVAKVVTAVHVGEDTPALLRLQRNAHLERMRDLVKQQGATADPAARIAIDHAVFHLDADLRWLEAAAQRIARGPEGKR